MFGFSVGFALGLVWALKNFLRVKFSFSVCFCGAVRFFNLGFWLCLLSLCRALQHSLWCGSMLVSVKFEYVARGSAGGEFWEEEGTKRLIPSSTVLL